LWLRRELSRLKRLSRLSSAASGFAHWRFLFGATMNLQSNDFELFELPVGFALDRAQLDERWKALQREVHPDRHAAADAQTQRQAMQWSVRINEAYQRLKDPLQRAAYLCELHGVPIQAENNTAMPAAFLMQQMEWREALDEATTAAQLDDMADEVAAARKRMLMDLQQTADVQRDWPALAGQVRALMFVERFARDVESRLEQLGQ
jgi:molecular chaperone HscB